MTGLHTICVLVCGARACPCREAPQKLLWATPVCSSQRASKPHNPKADPGIDLYILRVVLLVIFLAGAVFQ